MIVGRALPPAFNAWLAISAFCCSCNAAYCSTWFTAPGIDWIPPGVFITLAVDDSRTAREAISNRITPIITIDTRIMTVKIIIIRERVFENNDLRFSFLVAIFL